VLSFLDMSRLIFFVLLLSGVLSGHSAELRPFSTDFCTNFPEGTRSRPDLWKHCCLIHDLNFWAGGSSVDRNAADLELRSCIEATGAKATARMMYWAVRTGSLSPVKYPEKRWGNGWPGRKVDLALAINEIERIELALDQDDTLPLLIKEGFIRALYSRLE
jgi:hypothetical protein